VVLPAATTAGGPTHGGARMTGDRSPPQLCFSLSWQDSSSTAAVLIFRSGRLVGQVVVALASFDIGLRFRLLNFLDSVVRTSMRARIQSGSEARGTFAFIGLLRKGSPMPRSRHKLRNAGRVFATNRETRIFCSEMRLKQACGRCYSTRRFLSLRPQAFE